jgi:hypothetical protein
MLLYRYAVKQFTYITLMKFGLCLVVIEKINQSELLVIRGIIFDLNLSHRFEMCNIAVLEFFPKGFPVYVSHIKLFIIHTLGQ